VFFDVHFQNLDRANFNTLPITRAGFLVDTYDHH
jgi:hypothetical protein